MKEGTDLFATLFSLSLLHDTYTETLHHTVFSFIGNSVPRVSSVTTRPSHNDIEQYDFG